MSNRIDLNVHCQSTGLWHWKLRMDHQGWLKSVVAVHLSAAINLVFGNMPSPEPLQRRKMLRSPSPRPPVDDVTIIPLVGVGAMPGTIQEEHRASIDHQQAMNVISKIERCGCATEFAVQTIRGDLHLVAETAQRLEELQQDLESGKAAFEAYDFSDDVLTPITMSEHFQGPSVTVPPVAITSG